VEGWWGKDPPGGPACAGFVEQKCVKARLPGVPKPSPLPCLLPSAPDLSLPLAPPACCRHAHQTLWLRPEGADGAPGRQATRHRPPAGDLSLRDGEQKRPAHLPAQPSVSHRCIPQSSSQMGTVGECSAWSACLRPLLCCSAVLCFVLPQIVMIGDGITDLEAVQESGGADMFVGFGGACRLGCLWGWA
jgi:hypothetical protein